MVNPPLAVLEKITDELTGKHRFQWKFVATLTVSDVWIQDGFDLTLERLQADLEAAFLDHDLGWAHSSEVVVSDVWIASAPDPATIREAQGY